MLRDTHFWGSGTRTGTGLYLGEGVGTVVVEGCTFHYLFRGIYNGSTAEQRPSSITITDNHFDGGWYTGPAAARGTASLLLPEGDPLTVANSHLVGDDRRIVLSDPEARFLDADLKAQDPIRLLVPRASGESLDYRSATRFAVRSSGARPGDWIRTRQTNSPAIFGVVADATEEWVEVENWLDDRTRRPVGPPGEGTGWTIFRTVIGQVWAAGGSGAPLPEGREGDPSSWDPPVEQTRLYVDPRLGWRDMDGDEFASPVGQVEYEIGAASEYQVWIGAGVDRLAVTDNEMYRPFGDGFAASAKKLPILGGVISGNKVVGGQDMGFTFVGFSGSRVARNLVIDTGVHGMAVWHSSDLRLSDNTFRGGGWLSPRQSGSGVDVLDGSGHSVVGVLFDNSSVVRPGRAVRIRGPASSNRVAEVRVKGAEGVVLEGPGITTTSGDFSGVPVDLGITQDTFGWFSGEGRPTLTTEVGSRYTDVLSGQVYESEGSGSWRLTVAE